MKKNLLKIYGFILILLQSAVIAGCDNDDKNSTMNSSLANLGDFYYSDGTWSSNLNSHKEVIGIVFGISKINELYYTGAIHHNIVWLYISMEYIQCVNLNKRSSDIK